PRAGPRRAAGRAGGRGLRGRRDPGRRLRRRGQRLCDPHPGPGRRRSQPRAPALGAAADRQRAEPERCPGLEREHLAAARPDGVRVGRLRFDACPGDRVSRLRVRIGVLLAALAGGCGGGATGPRPGGPATGLAVVNSDFSTTSLSLLDMTGTLVRADCVDSATGATGGATKTISGDVVLPSQPQPGGDVILVDRGNGALTFVDPTTCTIVRQIPVPGVKTNPHDLVVLAPDKAYVTRYDLNLAVSDPD